MKEILPCSLLFSKTLISIYTLLPLLPPFFLQPSCGKGVTSSIMPILSPILDNALIAACAPGPGPVVSLWPPLALIFTLMEFIPFSIATSAALFAAIIAAVGLDSILSLFTTTPPEHLLIVSVPVISVMWIMVLLYDAKMCAMPHL